ncbi:abcA2, partial [Symbiodinium microadriaticum]
MGAFTIETYIYHHGSALNYDHVDDKKNLASLSSIVACLFFSACFYLFVCWGMPFDWIFTNKTAAEIFNRGDDAVFPCDDMDDDDTDGQASSDATLGRFGEVLLNVNDVYHVYPDGTRAVKGISFKVREGEVLSYLGANGAGKSTTMGMLCGTLDATFGDAVVNGFSITRDRSSARRNLGICMQQNVIWDDISIVDHLYLFARLRGMKGAALKEDVQNMMNHLGFPEKAHSAAGTLSGGQKRRLCVGISMVGGNSVVYLDEPTV